MSNYQKKMRKKMKRMKREKRIWMVVATSAMKAICLGLRRSQSRSKMMGTRVQKMKKMKFRLLRKRLRKKPRKQHLPMATCGKKTNKVRVERKPSRQSQQKIRTTKSRRGNRVSKIRKSRFSMWIGIEWTRSWSGERPLCSCSA